MSVPRTVTLTAATGLLIGLCYAVAAPRTPQPVTNIANSSAATDPAEAESQLISLCQIQAENLREQFQGHWSILIRSPFVLVSDLDQSELETLYRQTITPTVHALQVDYFDQSPTEPVTILVLSDSEQYTSTLHQLGHSRRSEYSGLYLRQERLVLINLSTGAGTLAHELTHALAHADFPDMPEWFDEGLASLHEDAEFSADGLHLIGQENWRMRYLQEADRLGRWKSIDRLFAEPFAEPEIAAVDYALARMICLELQQRGLLPAYYRKCRSLQETDPTGCAALRQLLPDRSFAGLDDALRRRLRSPSSVHD